MAGDEVRGTLPLAQRQLEALDPPEQALVLARSTSLHGGPDLEIHDLERVLASVRTTDTDGPCVMGITYRESGTNVEEEEDIILLLVALDTLQALAYRKAA
jgi:hypothetical protein